MEIKNKQPGGSAILEISYWDTSNKEQYIFSYNRTEANTYIKEISQNCDSPEWIYASNIFLIAKPFFPSNEDSVREQRF